MTFRFPNLQHLILTAAVLALGALGGWVARMLSLPLPWMLGALMSSALLVLVRPPKILETYDFPPNFRQLFVGLIGVMIGTQVTSELIAIVPLLPFTLVGLAIYVGLAFTMNYLIFRRFGGYDRPTALFSSSPGGLLESILMGEAAGAQITVLMVQQFLRIIFVIVVLPLGLSLWLGHSVGSASGATLDSTAPTQEISDYLIALPACLLALWLGVRIRVPAAPLVGPLLVTAALNLSGITSLILPQWLIAVAQLVIGASLGLRFKGIDRKILRQGFILASISVAAMLVTSLVFALILTRLSGLEFLPLFVSFAPGGLAEMAVIALSLGASPAVVSIHHIARILMTIIAMPIAARLLNIPINKGG